MPTCISPFQCAPLAYSVARGVHSLSFLRQVGRPLFTEADIFELELALLLNPGVGDVIPGARGLRKLRRPASGRGKRGGTRVIYYLVTYQRKILLLHAYAKNVQGDLTPAQAKQLSQFVHKEFP
jgi:hypothetical protein